MPAVPFHYLDLRTFCYATEDEERVAAAFELFVPEDAEIEWERTEGHHGDPIVVLSTRLETVDEMEHVLSRLPGIPGFDRVITELPERVDEECSFFLRLNKQRAVTGEFALGDGIHLRGKVEAYPAKQETALKNLRDAFRSWRSWYHDQGK